MEASGLGGSRQRVAVSSGLRFTDKDEHMYFWFPLLAGLSELTFDPRADIRYHIDTMQICLASSGWQWAVGTAWLCSTLFRSAPSKRSCAWPNSRS